MAMRFNPEERAKYGLHAGIEDAYAQFTRHETLFRSSQVEAMLESIERQDKFLRSAIGTENEAVQETIRRQAGLDEAARRLADSVGMQFSGLGIRPLEALEEMIARQEDKFLALALQPQLAFQEFEQQQLKLAATASEAVMGNRLALIEAATGLLDGMNGSFKFAARMHPAHSTSTSVPEPSPTAPPVSSDQELAISFDGSNAINVYSELALDFEEKNLAAEDADVEGAVLETGPARVTLLGLKLVRLVSGLNGKAEREGRSLIFKPTNKTFLACGIIPTRVATDELSFGEVVDHLYFLLYEGAGGSSSRLSKICSDQELADLWLLKSLRTGFRHDVDHGAAKEIVKKNLQLGNAYKSLVGKVILRSRTDWAGAQVALYGRLVSMLETVWVADERAAG
jgi:hypothetical protein